jgi:hypothetical protein
MVFPLLVQEDVEALENRVPSGNWRSSGIAPPLVPTLNKTIYARQIPRISRALDGHIGQWAARSAVRPCRQSGLMVSHWKDRLPAIAPGSRRLINGQVNRDASPHTQSPGSALRRRPQLAAGCWRGVLRVGARARPARTTERAVPAVLAEQDCPGPRGVRWLESGRAAGTGLTRSDYHARSPRRS